MILRALATALGLVALGATVPGTSPAAPDRPTPPDGWLSLLGTSGLVLIPTAEVAPDATLRFGYVFMDRKQTYQGREQYDNELYFLTFGFLPRVELSVRATVLPGSRLSRFDDAPIVDRLGSIRLQLVREGRTPALAVGMDDVRGTRLYHSLYVVATKGIAWEPAWLELRGSAGWGSKELDARRYLLEGFFGGAEVRFYRTASIVIDFDTEKWNSGVRLQLFRRVNLNLAWLDQDTPSWGAAWTHFF